MPRPKPIQIPWDLDKQEMLNCGYLSVERITPDIYRGHFDRRGMPEHRAFYDNYWSCHGEYVLHRWSEKEYLQWSHLLHWNSKGNAGPDVEPFHRRCTRTDADPAHLMVQKDDHMGIYVLVLAWEAPRFWIAGWCRDYEARQEKFWGRLNQNYGYSYNVPENILRDMSTLPVEEAIRGLKRRA